MSSRASFGRRPLIVALALLLAVVLPVQARAQPAPAAPVEERTAPNLSAPARALLAYAARADELPAGWTFSDPAREVPNEEAILSDPLQAALVQRHGRLTEVLQTASRGTGRGQLVVAVIAFTTPDGAWGDALDSTFAPGASVEKTVPGPAVGERSVLFRVQRLLGAMRSETVMVVFQRDRLEVAVAGNAGIGEIDLDELLPLARAIDGRIVATPPAPPTAAELALIEQPTPAVVVRSAVRMMRSRYFQPLEAADLLAEAWQGASDALKRAGVAAADLPPAPAYPADEEQAIALHMRAFPALERLGEGKLTAPDLAQAAVRELVRRRGDCHTYHLTAEQYAQARAAQAGQERPNALFGIQFSQTTPPEIRSVSPGSPAYQAGVRRGQTVMAVNGRSTTGPDAADISTALDRREGAPNTLVVKHPSGRVEELRVAPARFREPPMESFVLPDGVGLLRFYGFNSNNEQLDLMRQALHEFESQGVRAWIIDVRRNPGGSDALALSMASLFVEDGRLWGLLPRDDPPSYRTATGNVLPFQRPLVFIVNGQSASAAEIMPAALQARGRAWIVGEKTAGCIGSNTFNFNGLPDGSALFVTRTEIVIGPDDLRLHRVGITPDVTAPAPTAQDEEYGIDPQLDAALALLRDVLNAEPAPLPALPVGLGPMLLAA